MDQGVDKEVTFIIQFVERIKVQHLQSWRASFESSKLTMYRLLKKREQVEILTVREFKGRFAHIRSEDMIKFPVYTLRNIGLRS